MLIFVNDRGEIHDVNTTKDPTLTPIEVTDGSLDGMSGALICCYKVTVVDGVVVMRTPYVPSTVLESIDRLGKQTEAAQNDTDVVTSTTDTIMTDFIPELAEADSNLAATIDQILTEIIPGLVPEDEL